MQQGKQRIFGLDVLRAWAITWVVLFHLTHAVFNAEDYAAWPGWVRWVMGWFIMMMGHHGVDVFFVLSGYLIAGILFRQVQNFRDIPAFWYSRWLRTIPPYLVALLGCWVVNEMMGRHFNPVSYFFFVQNMIYPDGYPFFDSWSLCLEEWFYLTLPFLFLALIRVRGMRQVWIWGMIMLIPVSLRMDHVLRGGNYSVWQLPYRFDGLATGVWIAAVENHNGILWETLKRHACWLAFVFMAVWCVVCQRLTPETFAVEFLIVAWMCGLFLISSLKWKRPPGFLAKLVETVSLTSYSVYLINRWPIEWFGGRELSLASGAGAAMTIAAFGGLFYLCIEKPALKFRGRILRH